MITTQTEHKCVLDSCRILQQQGFEITYLPVQQDGLVDPGAARGGDQAGDCAGLGDARQQCSVPEMS